MKNGDNEESSPLLPNNSSSCVSLGNYFILLPEPYGGIVGELFDARHMEEPLDY